MNHFKDSRETTKDDKHTGRPVTVTNKQNQEYILKERRVTVENVARHFGI